MRAARAGRHGVDDRNFDEREIEQQWISLCKDVPTAAVINYLVTSSAVSDDLAYQMTKLIFESLPELTGTSRQSPCTPA